MLSTRLDDDHNIFICMFTLFVFPIVLIPCGRGRLNTREDLLFRLGKATSLGIGKLFNLLKN